MELQILHDKTHGWYVIDKHAPSSRKYLDKSGKFASNCLNGWHKTERAAMAARQVALGRHEQMMRERGIRE